MEYNKFMYLWPPRPEKPIPKGFIKMYEAMNEFICQIKKNGTLNVIAISPDKEVIMMNRHNEIHRQYTPSTKTLDFFKGINGNGWFVFTAELLHNKVKGIRDTNYIFDILVNDGEYLVGTTFKYRQTLLQKMFLTGNETITHSHYVLKDNVWLARNYDNGFLALFNSLTLEEDEGLVFKNFNATLQRCSKQTSNNTWQVKCRKSSKNYGF